MTTKPQLDYPLAIEATKIDGRRGSAYPEPFNQGFERRVKRALGNVFGLSQFGVNHVTLEPGTSSALRHWHAREDEFVYVIEGEITLVTDEGETVLKPGMAAGFRAGNPNGHHLVNKTDRNATYIEVGTRYDEDDVDYPGIDLRARKDGGNWSFQHKDGAPYEDPDH